jgi:hypothetical protein
MGSRKIGLHYLVDDLAAFGSQARAHFPADFAALCATVEAVEGVRFGEVFDRLVTSLDYSGGLPDALLQKVLAGALKMVRQGSERPSPPPKPSRRQPRHRRRQSQP